MTLASVDGPGRIQQYYPGPAVPAVLLQEATLPSCGAIQQSPGRRRGDAPHTQRPEECSTGKYRAPNLYYYQEF